MSGPPPALLAWRLRQAGCLPGLAAAAPDLPGARAVDGDLWAGDPPRHRRHACLVARIFLSLEPVLWSWSRIPPAPGGPAPDARARLLPCAAEVWLEADTGSESRRQWLAKLERYHLWAPGPLVAVAEDPRRVARLAAWLAAGPAPDPWPAGAFPLADLARTLPAWLAAHARPDPPPPAAPISCYWDHGPLSLTEALHRLKAGQVVTGVEIRHGGRRLMLGFGRGAGIPAAKGNNSYNMTTPDRDR